MGRVLAWAATFATRVAVRYSALIGLHGTALGAVIRVHSEHYGWHQFIWDILFDFSLVVFSAVNYHPFIKLLF
jgi:hypothetical protein